MMCRFVIFNSSL